MRTVCYLCLPMWCAMLLAACATKPTLANLPSFHYRGVILAAADLNYHPHDDIIFPSVIRTANHFQNALGKFYMYYSPHDTPGGICLAYADQLEGPWHEFQHNPIVTRDWAPHYKVSHVSGPDVIWSDAEQKLLLYYHGENPVTRLASSRDGIHFDYQGEAVTTAMFSDLSEASYGRVFEYQLPGLDNKYVMLLMGNRAGTRRIYLAWSRDGHTWQARQEPILDPPPGTDQVAGAVLFPWHGRNYLIAHANNSQAEFNTGFDLYAAAVDANLENAVPLGKFFDHTRVSPTNAAVMSPFFIREADRWNMFFNVGPRLQNKIGLAVSERIE